MKKRLSLLSLLFALGASLLNACGWLPSTPAAPRPPLRVEYTQWWGDYTLLVAQEKGFFAEYGLEVEPVYYPIFSDSFADLAAGQVDAALISSGDAIRVNMSAPTQIIALSDDGGYMPIVSRPEIASISDLRGKTIGILTGTHYEMLVSQMLSIAQMNKADVTLRNVNPEEAVNELLEDKIQAAFVWEPFTSQALKEGARILYPTTRTLRLFPDAVVFRKELVESRPQDVERFLLAWFRAVEFRLSNPAETAQIAAKYIGVEVNQIKPDPTLKIYTYQDNLKMYSILPTQENTIYDVVRKTADYFLVNGMFSAPVDAEAILNPEFLTALENQIGETP